MAITVAGTTITFNDNTVQTTKPMKLLNEVINSSTTTHTFGSLMAYNQLVLVWDANQFSGPSGTTINLTESVTSMTLTTREQSSIITSNVGLNNVTQITQLSGNTNILASFSSSACMTRGRIVLTKIRNMTSTDNQLWNAEIKAATTGGQWLANTKVGTNTVSGGNFSIGSIYMSLGQCNAINIRLYGVE